MMQVIKVNDGKTLSCSIFYRIDRENDLTVMNWFWTDIVRLVAMQQRSFEADIGLEGGVREFRVVVELFEHGDWW